jgi:hypothetical protein
MAASGAGNPQAQKASVMKDWIAAAGTRLWVSALVGTRILSVGMFQFVAEAVHLRD